MLIRNYLVAILFILFSPAGNAQICTSLGQIPSTAFPVCGTATFHQREVPICGGRVIPAPCDGTLFTDKNPYWYQFTCFESGTLSFRITPDIIFDDYDAALVAIDRITGIHASIEAIRKQQIPDWAYRDVLFMLIHYSIAAYELLERKLSLAEKHEVFDVFYRVGERMLLKGLPKDFKEY